MRPIIIIASVVCYTILVHSLGLVTTLAVGGCILTGRILDSIDR